MQTGFKSTVPAGGTGVMGGRGGSSGMTGSSSNPFPRSVVQETVFHGTNVPNITSKDRKILESFIQDEVKNVGPVSGAYGISRGISMSDAELDALQVGGTFAEGKLASWSSKVGTAQSFARNNVSDSKPNKVIIRTKDPSYQAAKIGRIMPRRKYGEAESIMSSKARFEITRMKIDKENYTEVWVKPIN